MKKIFSLAILIVSVIIFGLANQAKAAQLLIEYGYGGNLGMFGIADTAKAYVNNSFIGEAQALRIIKKQPGPNHLLVKETHYYSDGRIMYQGELEFRFGFGGGTLVSERSLFGTKRFTIFTGWPSGN